MSALPPCPKCNREGFVRHENVLKGGTSHRQLYCGACDFSWQDEHHQQQAPGTKQPPPDVNDEVKRKR